MTPVLELAGISKDYRGLRPLRIAGLRVAAGEHVAILGFDQPSAEVFINLATGATLPDAGEVAVLGRPTAAISDSADWLATVDRFGIVSERAVLLDELTVVQNLAMPFTLAIEPPSTEVRARAVALAREVGLPETTWDAPVSRLDAAGRVRVRLGRAIAPILPSSCSSTSAPPSRATRSRCSPPTSGRWPAGAGRRLSPPPPTKRLPGPWRRGC